MIFRFQSGARLPAALLLALLVSAIPFDPAWASDVQIPNLLTPSGTYSVGRTFLDWSDSHRDDPVAEKPGTKREFMVISWYPADVKQSAAHAPWMPERWVSSEADLLCYQRHASPDPLTIEQCQHAVREPVSYSVTNAEMAQRSSSWPILLFSPGAGVNPAFYSTFTEELASRGYVVFAIVPTGWVTTAFPDGHIVPPSDKRSDDLGWIRGTALPLWADDLRFMLDQIEGLNRDPHSIFNHRLNLNKVGAFGHSFGGAAALSAALHDHRILAVVNLDGSPFGVLTNEVLRKPLMVVKHDISFAKAAAPPDEAGKAMQARVEEELSSAYLQGMPGYRVVIAEAKHMTFCDMPALRMWADVGRRFGVEDPTDGEKTLALVREYVDGFFDKFLLGKPSTLLDRPPGRYGIATVSKNEPLH